MQETTKENLAPIERLKAGIWDIHEGITSGEGQKDQETEKLSDGTLPLKKYVAEVRQRYLLQKGFEEVLARNVETCDFLKTVVTDEQFHAEKAATDLRFFDVDPAGVQPVPATDAMIQFFRDTEARDPRLLLAIHYVIEGSNNGAMMIAQQVKKCYDLEGTDGTYHLQPYGPEIRKKWGKFREDFNTLDISDELMREMVLAGRETFRHMGAVMREARAGA